MKHMSLHEIAAACGGTYCGDAVSAAKEVSSVVIDSRKAEKDSLFVAIKGARVDGHTFIPQVMEKGALCSISGWNPANRHSRISRSITAVRLTSKWSVSPEV